MCAQDGKVVTDRDRALFVEVPRTKEELRALARGERSLGDELGQLRAAQVRVALTLPLVCFL